MILVLEVKIRGADGGQDTRADKVAAGRRAQSREIGYESR